MKLSDRANSILNHVRDNFAHYIIIPLIRIPTASPRVSTSLGVSRLPSETFSSSRRDAKSAGGAAARGWLTLSCFPLGGRWSLIESVTEGSEGLSLI